MIVTEVMPRGSIESILKYVFRYPCSCGRAIELSQACRDPNVTKTLPFAKRMKMAKDAALGMNWLHLSKPIFIHRDLKCGNLLVRTFFRFPST
jgi:serine/threonine protein kinase